MKPEDFVNSIRKSILNENIDIYRVLFKNTKIDEATDPYWKEALNFYNKLDDQSKEVFFKIVRQISADSISNILGVLDGSSHLENQSKDFKLVEEGSPDIINGDLQDIFLQEEES